MKNIFSIFTRSNNSFEGEANNEKTVLVLRRHPFFIILRLLFFIFLILLPEILVALFYGFLATNNLFDIFLFVSSVWYLFIWSAAFYSLTMYTLDIWIVTNRRIIDSKQHGFFNRTVSELHLSRIQDISVETKGIIQTFFRFGDLLVQTAGAEEKFKFLQIPHPVRVKDEIMKLASTHPPVHP